MKGGIVRGRRRSMLAIYEQNSSPKWAWHFTCFCSPTSGRRFTFVFDRLPEPTQTSICFVT